MKRSMILFTILAGTLLSIGVIYVAGANSLFPLADETDCSVDSFQLNQEGFDREACEQNCRSRYGAEPFRWGGRPGGGHGSPNYNLYASCIQKCNNTFWKEFDRNIRDLERER